MGEFVWTNPDVPNEVYEMRYIVTQFPSEDQEYVEWRLKSEDPDDPDAQTRWQKLPPFAMPPQEAIEYWHGPVIKWWDENQQGIIVAMAEDKSDVLCVNPEGTLFTTELVEFEFVDNEDHGDEVKPGDVIKVGHAREILGPEMLREWLS